MKERRTQCSDAQVSGINVQTRHKHSYLLSLKAHANTDKEITIQRRGVSLGWAFFLGIQRTPLSHTPHTPPELRIRANVLTRLDAKLVGGENERWSDG